MFECGIFGCMLSFKTLWIQICSWDLVCYSRIDWICWKFIDNFSYSLCCKKEKVILIYNFFLFFLTDRDNCNRLNFKHRLISSYIADSVCNIAGLQLSMLFTWPLLICYVVLSICRWIHTQIFQKAGIWVKNYAYCLLLFATF